MNRIDRLSAILIILQSSTTVKLKQITERFGISSRTLYRDLKALEEAGIPIVGNSREGYSLVEGFKLPPLMFTQKEAFAFLAAERLVDRFADMGFRDGYTSGIEKIKAVMRFSEKKTLDNLDQKIDSLNFSHSLSSQSQDFLQILMANTASRTKVRVSYFSYSSQQSSEREIDPIGIFFSLSHWYFIGYCYQANDYRTFRVDRVQSIKSIEGTFKKEHPSLQTFLAELENKKGYISVKIIVRNKDVLLIDESKYYQGLIDEIENGDTIELHFLIYSIEKFARWCLSYIDLIKIVSPSDLKSRIEEIIKKSAIQ